MSAKSETMLWVAQRVSAGVLALAVTVHLITVIIAVRGGLSAEEILGRLQGHTGWLLFYLIFVAAVSIHAPIGLRNIAVEVGSLRGQWLDWSLSVLGVCLLLLGTRAVYALYGFQA